MEHANPYAGLTGSPTPAEPEDPSDAVEERGLRDETGFGALAEAGGDVPPVASPPAMRRPSGPEGRTRALGGAEAEAPGGAWAGE